MKWPINRPKFTINPANKPFLILLGVAAIIVTYFTYSSSNHYNFGYQTAPGDSGLVIGQGGGPPLSISNPGSTGGQVILTGTVIRKVTNNVFWVGQDVNNKVLVVIEGPIETDNYVLGIGTGISALGTIESLPNTDQMISGWHLQNKDLDLLKGQDNYFSADQTQLLQSGQIN